MRMADVEGCCSLEIANMNGGWTQKWLGGKETSFLREVGLVRQPHLDSQWTQRALQREG